MAVQANGNNYHNFKLTILKDVQNVSQDKTSMDMTLDDILLLSSTCWQPLTIDLTEDKYTGRYLLGLNTILVPDSSHF